MEEGQRILGIVGKKGVGKTEVSNYLTEHYGFVERAFGDKLKEVVADVFDIPLEALYARDGKNDLDDRWNLTHRQILQKFGTEVARNVNPYVWVHHVEKWIKERPEPHILLSDVRFHTEVEMIRSLGGGIWKVIRDAPNLDFHTSEVEQDEIKADLIIHNNGTIENLHLKLDEGVKWYFRKRT